ncbi:hypothetical protein [Aliikangiella coralliicola]|uniref:DUF2971 domain-containing protein n=1 Tax=Aliikangiella coralliicola TaxID=2592383 RepID=A0A545TWC9_9GAMM|nr:hypothetical protein [Aliikangiella coralliicola]TQV81523.1 hypothetical protein FLL46_25580 [Aliikangiella coralliicola]
MSDLPATLTYFGNLQNIGQVINKLALPVQEAHQLRDPFLPDRYTSLAFTSQDMFDASVKFIAHAILGKSPPKGQPNHPLQKAIMRWRMENRFNDESEIKEALQGLLPAMVEKAFNEAKECHQAWVDYVSSKRVIRFCEKFQDLALWELAGAGYRGAAIKFKCSEDSIFKYCHPVNYQRWPAVTVNQQDYVEHMVGSIPEIEFNPEKTLLTQNYAHRQFKEWRLLVDADEHDEQWLEFPINLIQSVYIGALVPDKTVEQLKNHLARLGPFINVYHARCKANEFSFEFEKVSENLTESEEAEESTENAH